MIKKVIAVLLIVALAAAIVPAVAYADRTPEVDLETAVAEQVTAYIASVAQKGSAEQALNDMLLHAILKGGEDLIMDEGDAMTAALLNANLTRENLITACTAAIRTMQQMNHQELYLSGGNHWYTHHSYYNLRAYTGEEKDSATRVGLVSSASEVYGTAGFPKSNFNSNDEVMILLGGSVWVNATVRQTQMLEGTAVYTVDLTFRDEFNFDTDYTEEEDYDTSITQALADFGGLLSQMFLDEFYWECNVSFQLEVPYECDHSTGSYQWTYDPDSHTMSSASGDVFLENEAKQLEKPVANEDGTTSTGYYFQLDEMVTLYHDRPWVVEYTGSNISALSLSMTEYCTNSYPYLRQRGGGGHTMVGSFEWVPQEEDEDMALDPEEVVSNIWHYRGVKLSELFRFKSWKTYTYRLENVVAEDGSNMVYLTIYDHDDGLNVVESVPMDDYYKRLSTESDYTLMDSQDSWLSGKDIFINYIGSRSYPLSAGSLKLTIWENGQDTENGDTFTSGWRDADCDHAGGLVHTCIKCGYSYTTQTETATGHSFGEYISNNDATCSSDGTRTAVCSTCGETDTVTDPGTMTGHLAVELPGVDPTCTEFGMTAGTVCDYCGKVLTRPEEILPLGHRYLAANCLAPKTCTRCGESEGSLGDHNPVKLPGKKAACGVSGLTEGTVCGTCGLVIKAQEEIPALEHSWQEADCEHPRTCTLCGSTDGEALGHTESVVPGYDATCTECGLTDGVECAACGKVLQKQKVIEATGHSWEDGICADCGAQRGEAHEHTAQKVAGREPTCTEDGLTDGYVCSDCGAVIRPQTVIEAAGHHWADADCENPRTCTVCAQTSGEALGHDRVTDAATAPNCTQTGLTEGVHCGACGEVLLKQQVLAATDHVDANTDGKCDACGLLLETDPEPTEEPTEVPQEPTEAPSEEPTDNPTENPTEVPEEPTQVPEEPTEVPEEPTEIPEEPTEAPTEESTEETGTSPTFEPGQAPTDVPAEETLQSEIAIICVFVIGAVALVVAAACFLKRKKVSK